MTIVSKFRISYLVAGILVSVFAGMAFGIIVLCLFFAFFNFFEIHPKHIAFIWITGSFLCYILFCSPVQIIVTEEYIIFKNLFTRTSRRIKYDEIAKIDHDLSIEHAGISGGISTWNTTSIYTRKIELKNKKSISFDDYTYKNFKEIDQCVLENIRNIRENEENENI